MASQAFVIVLSGMGLMAQVSGSPIESGSLLVDLFKQSPVLALLGLMLLMQWKERQREQDLRRESNEAVVRLAKSVDRQARAGLILSLKLDPKNNAEVRDLLREIGESGDTSG